MATLSSQAASVQAPVRLDPRSVRRVLVVRPRYVGDLCLTLPVLDALRRHAPTAAIDYLTEAPYAPLLEGDPRLARVLQARRPSTPAATAHLLADLARTGYDVVLDLFCNPRTAVWTAATAARVRVGYAGKGWRSGAYTRFATHRGKSAVAFHLASVEALGWETDPGAVPSLALRPGEARAARARLTGRGVPQAVAAGEDGGALVALHPGARWPTRQWPEERYAALARRIAAERPDAWTLVLAGPGEEERARRIAAAAAPRATPVSDLDLRELAALLAACDAFVGPDSGPVHVAAAVGTPAVGIFGRNEPERFFPYPAALGHRAVYAGVWCSPCDLDVCPHTSCLAAITPEWVWRALAELLARPRARVAGAPA